jgi:hypothetical protein
MKRRKPSCHTFQALSGQKRNERHARFTRGRPILTYNDLTSKTVDKIVPRIVDSVFKNSPVLTRLKNKRRFQFEGGLTIRHNIMYAPLKGGSYQRGQAFDTSAVQTDTALYFNVKQYLTT